MNHLLPLTFTLIYVRNYLKVKEYNFYSVKFQSTSIEIFFFLIVSTKICTNTLYIPNALSAYNYNIGMKGYTQSRDLHIRCQR